MLDDEAATVVLYDPVIPSEARDPLHENDKRTCGGDPSLRYAPFGMTTKPHPIVLDDEAASVVLDDPVIPSEARDPLHENDERTCGGDPSLRLRSVRDDRHRFGSPLPSTVNR